MDTQGSNSEFFEYDSLSNWRIGASIRTNPSRLSMHSLLYSAECRNLNRSLSVHYVISNNFRYIPNTCVSLFSEAFTETRKFINWSGDKVLSWLQEQSTCYGRAHYDKAAVNAIN
ncbi:unnamed protein product [Albugo candida]|uniref:Uncharacterized protein n=1 Tax=Albugo candida TaxID=65357 RepID=A0A024G495_9STRA|nr:unnamed protein product [Albugo candida]|eukprot:CCI41134.1 unnamed protein product [Albugo candida]